MRLTEAALQGITRLRKAEWVNREDYVEIGIRDGRLLPWCHFHSPDLAPLGLASPSPLSAWEDNATDWVPYSGKEVS